MSRGDKVLGAHLSRSIRYSRLELFNWFLEGN